MQVILNEAQAALLSNLIDEGRFNSAEAAITAALGLLQEQAKERVEALESLRAKLDDARAAIERGEYIELDSNELPKLFEEIKARGRAKLKSQKEAGGKAQSYRTGPGRE